VSIRHLEQLLAPRSVAVFGASDRPGSVGATVWNNLTAGGFAGPLWAINPRRPALAGGPAVAALEDLPQAPDLAVICTPPDTVVDLVAALGRAGTRAAIVMTAGLGPARRQAMLEAARPALLRVLGPNCLGLLSPHLGLNASFAHTGARAGDLAFVSQSGALVTAVLDWAQARGIGFSHLVSLGEAADVDVGDLLDHLASDGRTRAILLYLESASAPRKFMSAARAAARNKPVIVVKAGRAGRGVQAAASHTGAMSGADDVFDAAIRRAGMLRVDSLQQLFTAAETLARLGRGAEGELTVITNGGGAGVLAADAAARLGVPLATLTPELSGHLDTVLPATWSRGNPIDIIGDAPVQRYTDTLSAVLDRPATGPVLLMHSPTAIVPSGQIAQACAPLVAQARGRVLACWLGDSAVAGARQTLAASGAADYPTPEDAVQACAMLATYRRNQALLMEVPTASEQPSPDPSGARRIVDDALAAGREMLDERAAKALLAAYGIPVVPTLACSADADAAVAAADALQRQGHAYPMALKILSPDLSHKSDVGGVVLGLPDEAALREAAQAMLARIARLRPSARIEGFTVQPMVVRPMAQELIAGASIDPLFGPVLLVGHGGTAVEIRGDRAIALPPLNRVLARDMIDRTRVAALLGAWRDHPAAKLSAVADVLMALSQMLADIPELAELDINPLWADHLGAVALDARVRLDRARPAGAANFAIAPYPAELAETVSWNGGSIELRPIRPEDGPQHEAFAARLGPEDIRLRFFSARRVLERSELARLTQIDYDREMAFLAVRGAGDGAETLGVVRAVADPDNDEAEFAIIIRPDAQRQGLGQLLMRKMIGHLRQRGTRRMSGVVLRENRGMRDLAQALGFSVDAAGSDPQEVRVVLALAGEARTA
jgi:acetyltransferase